MFQIEQNNIDATFVGIGSSLIQENLKNLADENNGIYLNGFHELNSTFLNDLFEKFCPQVQTF